MMVIVVMMGRMFSHLVWEIVMLTLLALLTLLKQTRERASESLLMMMNHGMKLMRNMVNQYMSNQEHGVQDVEPAHSDSIEHDDLFVDDEAGCEVSEHVTNLENPTIALGVTFEDRDTFKRAIRQFAVLNEFEIAAPYSESTRHRGFCKGSKSKKKRCKWRIHASQLQDGRTW
jgi:hypothetical protein